MGNNNKETSFSLRITQHDWIEKRDRHFQLFGPLFELQLKPLKLKLEKQLNLSCCLKASPHYYFCQRMKMNMFSLFSGPLILIEGIKSNWLQLNQNNLYDGCSGRESGRYHLKNIQNTTIQCSAKNIPVDPTKRASHD